MPSQQGSLDLLTHPVAQEMLQSPIPMRLSYVWLDGTPRVVPIGFHWNGSEIIIGGPPNAPKMKALAKNPKVALTIDSNNMPYHVLLIRGTASITTHEGLIPEYVSYCNRMMGPEVAAGWLPQAAALIQQMARVAIKPEWVGIMDFQTRFPSEVERAIESMSKQ